MISRRSNSRRILCSADFHMSLTDHGIGLLRFLAEEGPNCLVFDTGDFGGGSAWCELDSGNLALELVELIYDAVCPGNHDFDFADTCMRMNIVPVVCCNLLDDRDLPYFRRFVEFTGFCVTGIMGHQAFSSIPLRKQLGLRWHDPLPELIEIARTLKAGNVLIVLSHSSVLDDIALIRHLPKDTIIFGGHSHDSPFFGSVDDGFVALPPALGSGCVCVELTDGLLTGEVLSVSGPLLSDRLESAIMRVKGRFDHDLGAIDVPARSVALDRPHFCRWLSLAFACRLSVDFFILNDFTVREIPRGSRLSLGGLIAALPFHSVVLVGRMQLSEVQRCLEVLLKKGEVISFTDIPIERDFILVGCSSYVADIVGISSKLNPIGISMRELALSVLIEQ
jgi:hypothetical protein